MNRTEITLFDESKAKRYFFFFVFFIFIYFQIFVFYEIRDVTTDGYRDNFFASKLIELNFVPFGYREAISAYFLEFNVSASGKMDMRNPSFSYLFYIYVLAVCKVIAGDYWSNALIFVNAAAQTATTALCMWLAIKISPKLLPAIFVALFLLFGFDFYQWISLTQSTPIFLLFVSSTFLLCFHAWRCPEAKSSRWLWLAAISLAIFGNFVRPAAPPIIAMVAIAWLCCEISRIRNLDPTMVFRRCLLTMILLIGLGILLHGYLMQDPTILPRGAFRDLLYFFRDSQSLGWIMWQRPETFVAPPLTYIDYAMASAWRGSYFFFFVVESFSLPHVAFNIMYFVPLYLLSIIGAVATLRSKSGISDQSRIAGMLGILLILFVAAFVAVTYLDYDWRYRAPTLPGFIVLAAVGATRFSVWLERAARRFNVG